MRGLAAVGNWKDSHWGWSGSWPRLKRSQNQFCPLGVLRENGAAECGDEHGSDDFGPDLGRHKSGFVEYDEVEAFAAEVIGMEGAADGDHTAAGQVNAAFGFADFCALQAFDTVFQVAPDLTAHLPGRG